MSEREEWINLIHNEYDPKPDLGNASYPAFDSEWDDGAGRIADAILADKALLLQKQDALVKALTEAERFMSYFANETDGHFSGPGSPTTCLAEIRAVLAKVKES